MTFPEQTSPLILGRLRVHLEPPTAGAHSGRLHEAWVPRGFRSQPPRTSAACSVRRGDSAGRSPHGRAWPCPAPQPLPRDRGQRSALPGPQHLRARGERVRPPPCTGGVPAPGHSPNVILPFSSWSIARKRPVTVSSATPKAVLRMLDRVSSSMLPPSWDPYICKAEAGGTRGPRQPLLSRVAASLHGVPSSWAQNGWNSVPPPAPGVLGAWGRAAAGSFNTLLFCFQSTKREWFIRCNLGYIQLWAGRRPLRRPPGYTHWAVTRHHQQTQQVRSQAAPPFRKPWGTHDGRSSDPASPFLPPNSHSNALHSPIIVTPPGPPLTP